MRLAVSTGSGGGGPEAVSYLVLSAGESTTPGCRAGTSRSCSRVLLTNAVSAASGGAASEETRRPSEIADTFGAG
jgi:hypothetical protein